MNPFDGYTAEELDSALEYYGLCEEPGCLEYAVTDDGDGVFCRDHDPHAEDLPHARIVRDMQAALKAKREAKGDVR